MSIARDLLDEGQPLTAVARRLGYAHLSGFSRVFATAFGQPPGAYQRSLSA
jgi:AraC-like DNA-binding protein